MSEYYGLPIADASSESNTLKIFTYNGVKAVSASTTLDLTDYGYIINVTAASTTITLPLAADSPGVVGFNIRFESTTGTASVVTQTGDSINSAGTSVTSITLSPGDTLEIVSDGVNTWMDIASSSASSLDALTNETDPTKGAALVGYNNTTVAATLAADATAIAANTTAASSNAQQITSLTSSVTTLNTFKANVTNSSDATLGANLIGYNGGTVADVLKTLSVIPTVTSFTSTAGQTSFAVTYTPGLVAVYVNGAWLSPADYTASTGTAIVLGVSPTTGSTVSILPFTSLAVANTVSASDLASTNTTLGASMIGYSTTGVTVAEALDALQNSSGGDGEGSALAEELASVSPGQGANLIGYNVTGGTVAQSLTNLQGTVTALQSSAGNSSVSRTVTSVTATSAGQTSFSVTYKVNLINVYLNGTFLTPTIDYTATDGATVVLVASVAANVVVGSLLTFEVFASAIGYTLSAPVVGTITALKAVTHANFQTAIVTGYYTPGDGGGGTYYYDYTDTTSVDNGGTIIVATDGGRWKLADKGIISVKQFGAKGNGTSDDTTAINAAYAVTDLPLFPEGTYLNTITDTRRFSGSGMPISATSVSSTNFVNQPQKKTYLVVITGQSNAEGAHNGGPNPANSLVKVWDGVTSAWGSSDYTLTPFSRATPDGNTGNNNVGLAFAHRLADEEGASVYLVYDAVGGTPIEDWMSTGVTSVRYAAIKAKVEAALATTELTSVGKTEIDYLIWAQGEENALTDTMTVYRAKFATLDAQFRAETWMTTTTPMIVMGMSGLHMRYQVWMAQLDYCENYNRNCIYTNSAGLLTSYDVSSAIEVDVSDTTNFNVGDTITSGVATAIIATVTTGVINATNVSGDFAVGLPITSTSGGSTTITAVTYTSDYTHFLGPSLWESGYYRVWNVLKDKGDSHRQMPFPFYSRGTGPWRGDTTAISLFSSLVSYDSATSTFPINSVGSKDSISWGYESSGADYSMAGGYQVVQTSGANFSFGWGRALTFSATGEYGGSFGYQNALNNTYQFAAGRGHTLNDSGQAAIGTFSKYITTQTDIPVFQVGIGTSSSVAKNGLTVRKSGAVEINTGSTADPAQSQEITFEYLGNTSLKLKMMGTDGVVRSVTFTLA